MTEAKAQARKVAFARRKAAHRPGDHTAVLSGRLGALVGKAVAGYMPIRTEIDPLPAMARLAKANTLCVPVIQGEGQPLVFHRWTPGCALVAGPFGAQVPADPVPVVPDILIVPLVAFTRAGLRLGYGGGFYDRTLAALRHSRPTEAYGFAYDAQEMDELPQEPTDARLTAVVTESQIHWPPGHPRPEDDDPWPWPVPV